MEINPGLRGPSRCRSCGCLREDGEDKAMIEAAKHFADDGCAGRVAVDGDAVQPVENAAQDWDVEQIPPCEHCDRTSERQAQQDRVEVALVIHQQERRTIRRHVLDAVGTIAKQDRTQNL